MVTRILTPVLLLALATGGQAQTVSQPIPGPGATALANDVPQSPTPDQPAVPLPPTADCISCPTADIGHRLWGSSEFLVWWVEGQRVPALVTTSPPGTAPRQTGVIGAPGTTVLFGDSRLTDGARLGARVTLGMWLDDCRTCGIGGEFFILEDIDNGFAARSPGLPILARPFVNVQTGRPDAEIVSFPGLASGGVSASAESRLLGAGGFMRHALCCGCNYSVEGIAGYRYLNLDEEVSIVEHVTAGPIAPGSQIPSATFIVFDSYRARNHFHGADFGLAARVNRGRVFLGALAKLAIGANVRDVIVDGSTQISTTGQLPQTFPGGLLTAGRTGSEDDTVFALVPEFRLAVGYQLTPRLQVSMGYNVLGWTNVARAGEQIDLRVDPNLLPPALSPVTPQPLNIRDSTLWAHGFTVGFAFNY